MSAIALMEDISNDGSSIVILNQDFIYISNKKVAIDGDKLNNHSTHGTPEINHSQDYIKIADKYVLRIGDYAKCGGKIIQSGENTSAQRNPSYIFIN